MIQMEILQYHVPLKMTSLRILAVFFEYNLL